MTDPTNEAEFPRDPWAADLILLFLNPHRDGRNTQLDLRAASWVHTKAGWELGGLLDSSAAALAGAEIVYVSYPDHYVETLHLAAPPQAHAKTGDPRGTFTTLRIQGEPRWPGAATQHEAMLQSLRDEGFTIEGDDEQAAT